MSGTVEGGKATASTVKLRYGADYYVNIGRLGGQKSRGGGFASNPELARTAGKIGGKVSTAQQKLARPLRCELCNKSFTTKRGKNRHDYWRHTDRTNQVKGD